jgi:hypothetical protein
MQCVLWLRTLPLCWEGSDAAMHHAVPCGPWPSNIKKMLAGLSMQLGSRVSNPRAHVFKAPDIELSCKTCGQAASLMSARRADMRLQCHVSPVNHSRGTTTALGDPTGQCHTADRAQRGRMIRQDVLHVVGVIISTSS